MTFPQVAQGRKLDRHGYVYVRDELGRWIHEHRVVAERALGRPLVRGEHVHHIDEDPANNDPANLLVLTAAQHRRLHVHYDRIRREARAEAAATRPGPLDRLLEGRP